MALAINEALPTNYLALWGVGRDAKRRALAALEGAGLIRIVDRRPGHSTVVASVDTPKIPIEAEGQASDDTSERY